MTEPYLLLWLEAPLQAWGHDSKFGRRDSLDFPTKSGVLGLLCCALGAGGEQTELLAQLASLDMQLIAFGRQLRPEQPPQREPLLRDFQMVGSGYDGRDPWQSLLVPKKSDGTKPNGTGTKMTYRYYLQDMAFAVALQVPAGLADPLAEALQNPVWDLYLGRKCCVPAELIFQGQYFDASSALNRGAELAGQKQRAHCYQVVQGEQDGDEVLTLNDVPLQFGSRKRYSDRRVTVIHPEV